MSSRKRNRDDKKKERIIPFEDEKSKKVEQPKKIDELIQKDDIDSHPLKIGQNLVVIYRDGSKRLAKIIEYSESRASGMINDFKYYVHYHDFNRRMDEWVTKDRIFLHPSEANKIQDLSLLKDNSYKNDASHEQKMSEPQDLNNKKSQILTTISELDHDEHAGLDHASLIEHEEVTKVKNIKYVLLGKYMMECWYFSPFPKEYYPDGQAECIYFCEFTLRFFSTKEELERYQSKPGLPRHPPGNEIYRDENVSMFELDGAVEKFYCQNLCYFAKLFLDHKTLYWDVDPFLFYVLCTRDDQGYHPVGYFSKEKYSDLGYNLACILTFPFMQRRGFGRFLIAFSYELSKKENKAGSPEKPLSDLGALGYRSYWASTLVRVLKNYKSPDISIIELSRTTSIYAEDIVATLQFLGLLQKSNNDEFFIYAPSELLETLMEKYPENSIPVDPEKLLWAPLYTVDPKKDKWSFKAKEETRILEVPYNLDPK